MAYQKDVNKCCVKPGYKMYGKLELPHRYPSKLTYKFDAVKPCFCYKCRRKNWLFGKGHQTLPKIYTLRQYSSSSLVSRIIRVNSVRNSGYFTVNQNEWMFRQAAL